MSGHICFFSNVVPSRFITCECNVVCNFIVVTKIFARTRQKDLLKN